MKKSSLLRRIFDNKIALFFWLSVYICIEYIGLGPFSFIDVHDTIDYWITRSQVLLNHLNASGLTYWYPNLAGGVDRLTNNLIYAHYYFQYFNLFPPWLACQLFVFTHVFIAGYFTYRLCRDVLELKDIPSVFGGAFFALFTLKYINLQFAVTAFPFVLWSLEMISRDKTNKRYLKLAGLSILYAFGVSVVRTPFVLFMTFSWFIAFKRERRLDIYVMLFIYAAILVLWHAQDLFATSLYSPYSHRQSWSTERYFRFIKFIDDVIYCSVLPLLFSLPFIKKSKHILWRIITFTFLFILAVMSVETIQYVFHEQMTRFKGLDFTRFSRFQPFIAAIFGAGAVDYLLSKKSKKLTTIVIACFAIMFVQSLWIKVDHGLVWIKNRNFVGNFKSKPIEMIADKIEEEPPFRVASIARGMFPDIVHAFKLESVDGGSQLYPNRYKKFWSKVIEPLTQKEEFFDSYFNHFGYRIYLFQPKEMEGDSVIFEDYYRLKLLSLANMKYLITRIPVIDENLKPLIEQEKSWLALSSKEKLKINFKSNFEGNDYLYVYENLTAFPRAFLANTIQKHDHLEDIYETMSRATLKELRNSAYIESEFIQQNLKTFKMFKNGVTTMKLYSPDEIQLNAKLDGTGVLILTNNYSPHWKCFVDGVETEIFPVDGAFTGVLLDKGEHKITFKYLPPYRIFAKK